MVKYTNKLSFIFMVVILLSASCSLYSPEQEKEDISKVMDDYFSSLAKDLRSGGVTGIEITSKSIQLKGGSAVADASININVYFPPTGEKRTDKDNVHFSFRKSEGEWVIQETKFDKTRF